jgi:DNA repair and recombination protein RAD54B
MLKETHDQTGEKVVVVSNWTSTLDIIQEMLVRMKYPYLRLDGSTAQKTRQGLVDQFNRGRREDSFVFLLSAKAGGTGLNLIGYVRSTYTDSVELTCSASRLILFDSGW